MKEDVRVGGWNSKLLEFKGSVYRILLDLQAGMEYNNHVFICA